MTLRILLHQEVVEPGGPTLKGGAVTTALNTTPRHRQSMSGGTYF